MKSIRAMLLPIFLTGIGCVTLPSLKDEPAPKAATAERLVANAPSSGAHHQIALPPVNPDEVTDANAGEKAEALRKELSREDK